MDITLIDKRNFHLFQPLLYQVATGGLGPAEIAAPLRSLFRRQPNIRILCAEVVDIDPERQTVVLHDGQALHWDYLVIAAGASSNYFGNDSWAPYAPGLKTIEDAQEIRRRVLSALETAERIESAQERKAWLTFVVVGGGPTGVEMAGALAELVHVTVRDEYRAFDPRTARVLLLEGAPRVLTPYPEPLSENARQSLQQLGVEVITGAMVQEITPDHILYTVGEETFILPTRTVVWAAGVRAAPLAAILARCTNTPTDRGGRLIVAPDLSLPDYPNIFVIGDMAHFAHQTGAPLPGVAPVAMQQGRYVARRIRGLITGAPEMPPFHYHERGNMAVIGRKAAVAQIGRLHFTGWFAWLMWLFVHLMFLVGFENRLLVFVQWAWNYFTRNRRARLILGESHQESPRESLTPQQQAPR
ncbi:MAG: NADH dehydrogenase [Fimbriimonadales bacterium]|nr:MAG: NADH dehydrogenase [Fimbriimonadales bacterium]